MRVEFCTFTDHHGDVIAVNPQHVRCVQQNTPGSARIEFEDTHYVIVNASVIDVTHALRIDQN
jgi:F0F1-type ATP synthase epsilon subunit